MTILGTHNTRTASYHSCVNGLVERLHCQLKAALMAWSSNTWFIHLPLVLLGIPSSLKVDLKCTAPELVYSTTLHFPPGDFFPSSQASAVALPDPLSYVCGMTQVHGWPQSVSIDRLKPAILLDDDSATVSMIQPLSTTNSMRTIRSGRQVCWPDCLNL